jgi:predicted transcriptional regulator
LFQKYPTLTNAIIRQELGFDDRVIVNYMDELERLGKVRQVGKTGKNAYYERI